MKKTTAPFLILVALLLVFGVFQSLKMKKGEGTSSSVAELADVTTAASGDSVEVTGAAPAAAPDTVPDISRDSSPATSPATSHDTAKSDVAPATPDVTGAAPTGEARLQAPAPPAPSKAACFKVSFQHKVASGHPDRARCARHRNFLELEPVKEQAAINWKTVCLRVDGVVTPFERRNGGIAFGPLAGPDSRVTVSYCRGKAACASPCPVPSDPFLEAISVSLKREKNPPQAVAKWDPSDTEEEADPTQALEAELKDDVGLQQHGLSVFSGWLPTSRIPGCGTTVASGGISGKDYSR